jgi:AdoMet-dependent rRNA methyltransferase SPB1
MVDTLWLMSSLQLERLNAEQAARTKRERRRANEVKTKTIQRMQLQMTAPMDIGMEQHDASLGFGQDDVFDLTGVEKGMRKSGGVTMLIGEKGMPESDESEVDNSGDDEDEEMLDSEEERERKVAGLEVELDGMYDIYQQRMRERDAKFKVKEARKKSGQLEEWNGIEKKDSDADDDDSGSEDGGWEKMKKAKEKLNDDSSSDESDDNDIPAPGQKRQRNEPAPPSSKRVKLLTKLDEPKSSAQTSRAAQVWFSQDVFAGMDGLGDSENVGENVSMVGQTESEEEFGWQDEASHILNILKFCIDSTPGFCWWWGRR